MVDILSLCIQQIGIDIMKCLIYLLRFRLRNIKKYLYHILDCESLKKYEDIFKSSTIGDSVFCIFIKIGPD